MISTFFYSFYLREPIMACQDREAENNWITFTRLLWGLMWVLGRYHGIRSATKLKVIIRNVFSVTRMHPIFHYLPTHSPWQHQAFHHKPVENEVLTWHTQWKESKRDASQRLAHKYMSLMSCYCSSQQDISAVWCFFTVLLVRIFKIQQENTITNKAAFSHILCTYSTSKLSN